jgi:hypothetical protein
MSETSTLRDQAVNCRRMAANVDPVTQDRLIHLASEYDARALKIEERFEDKADAQDRQ